MTQDEKLTNLVQLKYIIDYIQRKTTRVKEAYDNARAIKELL